MGGRNGKVIVEIINRKNGAKPKNVIIIANVSLVLRVSNDGIAIAKRMDSTREKPVNVPQTHPLRFFLSANL